MTARRTPHRRRPGGGGAGSRDGTGARADDRGTIGRSRGTGRGGYAMNYSRGRNSPAGARPDMAPGPAAPGGRRVGAHQSGLDGRSGERLGNATESGRRHAAKLPKSARSQDRAGRAFEGSESAAARRHRVPEAPAAGHLRAAAQQAHQDQPAAAKGPVAVERLDRVGRAARGVRAARRPGRADGDAIVAYGPVQRGGHPLTRNRRGRISAVIDGRRRGAQNGEHQGRLRPHTPAAARVRESVERGRAAALALLTGPVPPSAISISRHSIRPSPATPCGRIIRRNPYVRSREWLPRGLVSLSRIDRTVLQVWPSPFHRCLGGPSKALRPLLSRTFDGSASTR